MFGRDQTRRVKANNFTTIVITGNKGGTGKTTIAALLTEYLWHRRKKVNLIDTDPNRALQTWIDNCQEENRIVSSRLPVAYQIIDTAGVSSGSLTYLKKADLILVPFVAHYVDLQTKEQKEGLEQLAETLQENQAGTILPSLSNRPALYGSVLNATAPNAAKKTGANATNCSPFATNQNDYTYSSLSDLIRTSLQAYQNGEIKINPTERDKFAPKKE
ncbi:30992_t:CDS:2, partial [Racocetra persica]